MNIEKFKIYDPNFLNLITQSYIPCSIEKSFWIFKSDNGYLFGCNLHETVSVLNLKFFFKENLDTDLKKIKINLFTEELIFKKKKIENAEIFFSEMDRILKKRERPQVIIKGLSYR